MLSTIHFFIKFILISLALANIFLIEFLSQSVVNISAYNCFFKSIVFPLAVADIFQIEGALDIHLPTQQQTTWAGY